MSARARPTPRTVATRRSRSTSVRHIQVYSPTRDLSASNAKFATENWCFTGHLGGPRTGTRGRSNANVEFDVGMDPNRSGLLHRWGTSASAPVLGVAREPGSNIRPGPATGRGRAISAPLLDSRPLMGEGG